MPNRDRTGPRDGRPGRGLGPCNRNNQNKTRKQNGVPFNTEKVKYDKKK